MKSFLAESNRSPSSRSIANVNSGAPLDEAVSCNSEAGLDGWGGRGLRRTLGRRVGGCSMRMSRKFLRGSEKTTSSYCQEWIGSVFVFGAGAVGGAVGAVGVALLGSAGLVVLAVGGAAVVHGWSLMWWCTVRGFSPASWTNVIRMTASNSPQLAFARQKCCAPAEDNGSCVPGF